MATAKKCLAGMAASTMALLLVGCSHNVQPQTAVVTNTQYVVDDGLETAAQQATASLAQLAAIEKASYPHDATLPFSDVHTQELDTFVSVQWYGPIGPLLQEVAQQIGYT